MPHQLQLDADSAQKQGQGVEEIKQQNTIHQGARDYEKRWGWPL